MKLVTVKQFARELQISDEAARKMASSDDFYWNGIAFDASTRWIPRSKNMRNLRGRKPRGKKRWRIVIDRYYAALNKDLLRDPLRVV